MRYVWLLLLALVLAAEAYALVRPALDDTLSYQVWRLREHWAGRTALVAVYAWLGWHWFAESPTLRREWRDDVFLVLAVALVAGLILRYTPFTR